MDVPMGGKEDYERSKASQRTREQEKKAQRGFGKRTFRHPDRMVRFTWWVATFTFCLAFTAAIQTWAFIQSERAFVSPIAMRFIPAFPQSKIASFTIEIKNSGRSTASVRHSAYTITPKLPENADIPELVELAFPPVVAGGVISSEIKVGPLADDVIKEFSGTEVFYIYGIIDYVDDFSVFGNKRDGWCYIYKVGSNASLSQFDTCNNPKYTYTH
jgi:hypothetical protein